MVWDGVSFIIDSSICNVFKNVDVARIDDVDDGDVQLSSPSPSITSHLQSSSNSPHFAHLRNTAVCRQENSHTLPTSHTLSLAIQNKSRSSASRQWSTQWWIGPGVCDAWRKNWNLWLAGSSRCFRDNCCVCQGNGKKHQEKVLRAEERELWIVSGMF